VQSDNRSNLLATPSVTVIDNQPARFLAGQEVPVTSGRSAGRQFREHLPHRSAPECRHQPGGGAADQRRRHGEARHPPGSELGRGHGRGRNSADLILNKREIETSIVVDNGDIIGIGGLLNDNERRTIEKIPLLGDLPVVGNLFKSRGRARDKTNLMVFIRPTILRSAADARAMTNRRYGYIRDRQYLQNPTRSRAWTSWCREYMGAAPPLPPPRRPRGAADPAGRPGREPIPTPPQPVRKP
jgi:general secretion pathway protein D